MSQEKTVNGNNKNFEYLKYRNQIYIHTLTYIIILP